MEQVQQALQIVQQTARGLVGEAVPELVESRAVVEGAWRGFDQWRASGSLALSSLFHTFLSAEPLEGAVQLMFLLAFLCWLFSVVSANYSQVDRLWSLAPALYVWHFALSSSSLLPSLTQSLPSWPLTPSRLMALSSGGVSAPAAGELVAEVETAVMGVAQVVVAVVNSIPLRLRVMALLSSVWGLRLSYNFYRKGGYNPRDEDYRWQHVQKLMPAFLFPLFNISFIALYQNFLLLLIALPAYPALLAALAKRSSSSSSSSSSSPSSENELVTLDYVAVGLFVVLWIGETVADQQQWWFHQDKEALRTGKDKRKRSKGREDDLQRGFLTHGLFRFSRHPNFFCEISLWWAFYLFSVAASGVWLNYSALGAFLLTLLFQGSTNFTESLSLAKYPDYAFYQARVSRLIPLWPSALPPPSKPKAKPKTN